MTKSFVLFNRLVGLINFRLGFSFGRERDTIWGEDVLIQGDWLQISRFRRRPMNMVLDLLKEVLELADSILQLPEDWNDEDDVASWLFNTNDPLARIIALLTPDSEPLPQRGAQRLDLLSRANSCILQGFSGKTPKDVDWGAAIDWIADLLIGLFPQYETIITLVVTVIKQLVILLRDRVNQLDSDLVKRLCLNG